MSSDYRFTSIDTARSYALAGNATLTLESLKSGVHFTFRVRAPREKTAAGGLKMDLDSDVRFVSTLASGNGDDGRFQYLGMVKGGRFTLTRASKVGLDAPSVKAFRYFLSVPAMPEQLAVHHHGQCGRCGRMLTVPASIEAGIGPECIKIQGGAHED